MSEIMDDYDAGKKFAQNKVLELMDEVIEQYEGLSYWSEQENNIKYNVSKDLIHKIYGLIKKDMKECTDEQF